MQNTQKKLTACAVAAILGLSCMVYPVHAEETESGGQTDTGELLEADETAVPLEEKAEPEAAGQTNGEAEPQKPMETVNMRSSARASAVTYLYYENGTWKTGTVTDYTTVTSGMDTTWESGWYVVDRDVSFNSRIYVKQEYGVPHTVNLILKDGCTLTANQGIEAEDDPWSGTSSRLNIYAQSTGGDMGALIAQGPKRQGGGAVYDALGKSDGTGSQISIYGGRITATANETDRGPDACGITSPTIYGGIVTATTKAEFGYGISRPTIYGGIVTATNDNPWGYGIDGNTESFKPYGNAIIFAKNIKNKGDTSAWKGVIFEGNSGKVYGTQTTIDTSFENPSGYILTVPNGTTLTIPDGVTLTNNGTIVIENDGAINGVKNIINSGTIRGLPAPTPTVTIAGTTANSITVTELENKDTYGGAEYSLDNKNWQSGNVFTDLHSSTNYTVYARYKGNSDYKMSDAGKAENVSTNAANYTITIPAEPIEAGNSESKAELKPSDEFDLGYGGTAMVKVKENSGVDNDGKLTLTRQNDTENYTITSALLVNGTALGNINNNVATFTMNNKTPVSVSFAKPTETDIPAGTYSGTITFVVSYSEPTA